MLLLAVSMPCESFNAVSRGFSFVPRCSTIVTFQQQSDKEVGWFPRLGPHSTKLIIRRVYCPRHAMVVYGIINVWSRSRSAVVPSCSAHKELSIIHYSVTLAVVVCVTLGVTMTTTIVISNTSRSHEILRVFVLHLTVSLPLLEGTHCHRDHYARYDRSPGRSFLQRKAPISDKKDAWHRFPIFRHGSSKI